MIRISFQELFSRTIITTAMNSTVAIIRLGGRLFLLLASCQLQNCFVVAFSSSALRFPSRACPFQPCSATLTSALEEYTPTDEQSGERLIKWQDPKDMRSIEHRNGVPLDTIPLYPLNTVYLPSLTSNHTLRNVERRNIQMAMDLREKSQDMRFCVVLRATDTGAIATVGTVLQVIDMKIEKGTSSEKENGIRRVVITCVAQERVRIVGLENPQAATLEYRLQHPTEYLVAQVEKFPGNETMNESRRRATTENEPISEEVTNIFNQVVSLYTEKKVGEIPDFAFDQLRSSLASISKFDVIEESSFWQALNAWQLLCETIKAERQTNLSTDRNEFLIECAIRKGGPLKLPVHVEELEPCDRSKIQTMERDAQIDWIKLGLEPCLDFQVLLEGPSQQSRLKYFRSMLQRELERLRDLQEKPSNMGGIDNGGARQQLVQQDEGQDPAPRKGAWFDDDAW